MGAQMAKGTGYTTSRWERLAHVRRGVSPDLTGTGHVPCACAPNRLLGTGVRPEAREGYEDKAILGILPRGCNLETHSVPVQAVSGMLAHTSKYRPFDGHCCK